MDIRNSETERRAFSIQDFCFRNSISTTTYFKLRRNGLAPLEMKLGRAVRISAEAETVWRQQRERPSDTESRLIQREAEARVRRAKKAGAASVASPNHVSKRTIRT